MKSSWEYYPSISYPYCEKSEKVLDAFFLIFISMELALDPLVIFFVKALELSFCETTLLVLPNFRIPLLDGKNLFIGQIHVFVKMMFIFYKRNQEIPCHMSL